MKKTIKLSRASFPGVGNFSWMNYFVNILNKKYNVVIDAINPDIVIYTNQFYRENELDYETIFTFKKFRCYFIFSDFIDEFLNRFRSIEWS